jgi:hypothetical protein
VNTPAPILANHTITSHTNNKTRRYPAQVRPYWALAQDQLSVRLPDRRRPIGSLGRRMSQPRTRGFPSMRVRCWSRLGERHSPPFEPFCLQLHRHRTAHLARPCGCSEPVKCRPLDQQPRRWPPAGHAVQLAWQRACTRTPRKGGEGKTSRSQLARHAQYDLYKHNTIPCGSGAIFSCQIWLEGLRADLGVAVCERERGISEAACISIWCVASQ